MLRISVCSRQLRFAFVARTSRGSLLRHKVWYVRIWEEIDPQVFGWGECAPLLGLSVESEAEVLRDLKAMALRLKNFSTVKEALAAEATWRTGFCASVCFGVETALWDLKYGGKRQLFAKNSFFAGAAIPINGLIWMGKADAMWQQIEEKVRTGFTCLKLKVGGLNFEEECRLLSRIRAHWSVEKLILRLDANGAFTPVEAADRLKALARYDIHSIEQPVSPEEKETCAQLGRAAEIPIALDESLIGASPEKEGDALLDILKPQFLVLKPTLLGGFSICKQWIAKAEARGIGWWLTSALESNIGLNAIAQFSASVPGLRTEGLGTGQLYTNNIKSPLKIAEGHIYYDTHSHWDLVLWDTG